MASSPAGYPDPLAKPVVGHPGGGGGGSGGGCLGLCARRSRRRRRWRPHTRVPPPSRARRAAVGSGAARPRSARPWPARRRADTGWWRRHGGLPTVGFPSGGPSWVAHRRDGARARGRACRGGAVRRTRCGGGRGGRHRRYGGGAAARRRGRSGSRTRGPSSSRPAARRRAARPLRWPSSTGSLRARPRRPRWPPTWTMARWPGRSWPTTGVEWGAWNALGWKEKKSRVFSRSCFQFFEPVPCGCASHRSNAAATSPSSSPLPSPWRSSSPPHRPQTTFFGARLCLCSTPRRAVET